MEKYVSNNFRSEKKEQIEYIHTSDNCGKNVSINKKVSGILPVNRSFLKHWGKIHML